MHSVSKEFRFEASHVLPRHPGKCQNLHGHSWRVKVTVWGKVDHKTQFVMDFAEIKRIVKPIIDEMDHKHLNLLVTYPSSECIASWLGNKIQKQFQDLGVYEIEVAVSETQDSWATWTMGDPVPWGAKELSQQEREELWGRCQFLWTPRAE